MNVSEKKNIVTSQILHIEWNNYIFLGAHQFLSLLCVGSQVETFGNPWIRAFEVNIRLTLCLFMIFQAEKESQQVTSFWEDVCSKQRPSSTVAPPQLVMLISVFTFTLNKGYRSDISEKIMIKTYRQANRNTV